MIRLDWFTDFTEGFRSQFFRVIVLLVIGCVLIAALVVWPRSARAQVPAEAATYKREYVRIARLEWGLDAPIPALAAQIHQESGWNCRAVSRVGAKGCAQFMPTTANWIGDIDSGLRDGDVYSPAWAFRAQVTYMKWLHARIKASDECNQLAFAMAAYNGGLGYVYRRQKLSKHPGVCFVDTCEINPGILAANQQENAYYPRRILLEVQPRYETWGPVRVCRI